MMGELGVVVKGGAMAEVSVDKNWVAASLAVPPAAEDVVASKDRAEVTTEVEIMGGVVVAPPTAAAAAAAAAAEIAVFKALVPSASAFCANSVVAVVVVVVVVEGLEAARVMREEE